MCEPGKHLWDYRWNGEYRRCRRKDCKAAEWNVHGEMYLPGHPCSISGWHELSARAVNSDRASLPQLPEHYHDKGAKEIGIHYDREDFAKRIEQNYFMKQKDLLKKR